MIGNNKEHWEELCAKAAVEQDPEKLMALVNEISRLLAEKQARLEESQSGVRTSRVVSDSRP